MAEDEYYGEEDLTEETRRLLARAGIPEEQWGKWGAQLKEWGEEAYYYGDSEALYQLGKFFQRAGAIDKAVDIISTAKESVAYYEEKYGAVIYWDWEAGRWRSTVTGRFVKAPDVHMWTVGV